MSQTTKKNKENHNCEMLLGLPDLTEIDLHTNL